ncbi:MAG: LamB/YcsF family protein [Saprospiraceae bacterium]|nr:LamB/YcsF family protein [Saprospiraceae bacterium]
MKTIPINIDCGENFGRYRLFEEQPITRLASFANVACGFHAGDYTSIIATLELMKSNGIKVGAHPSFPDLQGFGRRYMPLEFEDLVSCIFYQIATLKGLCEAMGLTLNHVKAHGACTMPAVCRKKKQWPWCKPSKKYLMSSPY